MSKEYKKRCAKALRLGMQYRNVKSQAEMGRLFKVSLATAQRWLGKDKDAIPIADSDPFRTEAEYFCAMADFLNVSIDTWRAYLRSGDDSAIVAGLEAWKIKEEGGENPIPAIEFVKLDPALEIFEAIESLTRWFVGTSGESWRQSGILAKSYRAGAEKSPEQILFSEVETFRVKMLALGENRIALGVGAIAVRTGETIQSVKVVPKILPLEPESFPSGLKLSISQEGKVYQSFDIPNKRGVIRVGDEGFFLDAGDRFELKFEWGDNVVEEKFVV